MCSADITAVAELEKGPLMAIILKYEYITHGLKAGESQDEYLSLAGLTESIVF